MMRIAAFMLSAVLLAPVPAPAQTQAPAQAQAPAQREKAPDGARAYIIWPADGAVIQGGKLWVRMGLQNMGLTPAGIRKPDAGHHHLLIDTELKNLDEPIPNNKQNLHFGTGQTEARIELPPGRHTLQMVLGDADHVPHDPPVVSQKITIIVP